jgi:heat shock protein HslJ
MRTAVIHRRIAPAVVGFVIPLLASCSTPTDLVGPTWVLAEEAEVFSGELALTEVTLAFKPDGTVTGFYSYLNYSGTWSTDGSSIAISDICWLSLICQADTPLEGPRAYVDILMRAESYSIEGNSLTLHTADGHIWFHAGT